MKVTATRPPETPALGVGETFTCCETPIPWPARTEDRTCPECGTVWEHDGVDLGAGARIKPEPAPHVICEPADLGLVRLALADAVTLRTVMQSGCADCAAAAPEGCADHREDAERAAAYELLLRRLVVTG